ncbi:hypothetical protein JKP88DRAFT_178695 [Tribonema minus]|uniref:J domain-containing protein n=1 Tax=Tribonema minus TaxID=303371 RepID=A0A836CIW0_9STRA|nr:hypothetical protein JKP88DRAFT_178695 [Tribonema minus]
MSRLAASALFGHRCAPHLRIAASAHHITLVQGRQQHQQQQQQQQQPVARATSWAAKQHAEQSAPWRPGRHPNSNPWSSSPQADPDTARRCGSCGAPVSKVGLFCECGRMQPLSHSAISYFELLDCPFGVIIDPKLVERRFWALQKQLHPDLHAVKSQEEQAISAANTAFVNQAYQTLRDPVKRVRYVLQLMKGQDEAEAAAHAERSATPPDPALLMFVYDTRERLERCASEQEARYVLRDAEQSMDAQLSELRGEVAAGDVAAVERGLNRLQYLAKIAEEACSVEHRLADAAAEARG